MEEVVEQNEVVVNGCRVIDKGNGLSSFVPIDDNIDASREDQPHGFFEKIANWLKKSNAKPYAKVRDLADPLWTRHNDVDDRDVGRDGKIAAEVGIKIEF